MIVNARKKPVIIQAIKVPEIFNNVNIGDNKVLMEAIDTMLTFEEELGIIGAPTDKFKWRGGKKPGVVIPTLEGDHLAEPGDWIIKGVKDEFYPCKPDIFERTYEIL